MSVVFELNAHKVHFWKLDEKSVDETLDRLTHTHL